MERTRSPLQVRNSRRVVVAARRFVEAHGLEAATMRRLATEADVSTRTLYNLFGDKRGLLQEIMSASLDEMDFAIDHLVASSPLERIWEAVGTGVDTIVRSVPKAVLTSVLADDELLLELSRRWPVGDLIEREILAGRRARLFYQDVEVAGLLYQFGLAFVDLLRQWAADERDARAFRSGALYAVDLCLLAIARPAARTTVSGHMTELPGPPPAPPQPSDPGAAVGDAIKVQQRADSSPARRRRREGAP